MAGQLSDNYFFRKCYFDTDTVPTQSVMLDKMRSPLAKVYFKSMNRKLKVLAGLEPPLKGGGNDWFIPPEEVLNGRLVMKPVANDNLKKLGFNGIVFLGEDLVERHHQRMEAEISKVLNESDESWKKNIEASCRQHWEISSKEAASNNTKAIQQAFHEFTTLYTRSISCIENVLFDAAIKDIQAASDETFEKMQARYKKLLHDQATMLYDLYEKKLIEDKANRKADFIKQVEEIRTDMLNQISDIKFEKHVVVEKLRQLQESMNLACQVYVGIKEREACRKEMELSKHTQQKKIKTLKENIDLKNFEIRLLIEQEKKCEEFNTVWKKKICEVIKKFQLFVSYCFKELPEYADFLIDMEKLMMLQLSEVVDNPKAESVFEPEEPKFYTPIPRPHPFYLFCDKGYKPQLDKKLCPKRCTSSASQLPVVVVNKRLIYAACDNFEMFTDKITEFIHGHRGEDIDFEDHHAYEHDVPVKLTSSMQLLDLKLQSSIMQVLQNELPNVRVVPTACCVCNIPYCFCSPSSSHDGYDGFKFKGSQEETWNSPSSGTVPLRKVIESRSIELAHEREPKWQSYMNYIMPQKCHCRKTVKKHLNEHLPAYMKNMSKFEEPAVPNYEICPLTTLKRIVKNKQGIVSPLPVVAVESKVREVGTQYSDQNFEYMCTCFSEEEIKKLFRQLAIADTSQPVHLKILGDDMSTNHLEKRSSSFALDCANKLRKLLDDSPQLQAIFKKDECL